MSNLEKHSKIFVAGARGLVGSAIVRRLRQDGFENIITKNSTELDLRNQYDVDSFFREEQPEFVFLAAAKVGGIHANTTYPAEFIYNNLMIEANVIHSAYKYNVQKLLFLGSSCIYPKLAPQPIKEEYLLSGDLEPTNEPYAIAKIAGIKLCQAYRRQYGCNFISGMPTNLYGINDNFNLDTSHVIPALIRKFHEAKLADSPNVVVWGTGSPRREFLYADDLADACLHLMKVYEGEDIVNIGTGEDLTIAELAAMIRQVVGYTGNIQYDTSKPDGTPVKRLDVTKAISLGWKASIELQDGLKRTYDWFITRK